MKNLKCHLIQKTLKEQNNGEKGIPQGDMFEYVSCANYFWEVCSWLNFALFTGHWSSFLFVISSLLILMKWAKERHDNYKKIFPAYPKGRKALIPFIF